MKECILSYHKNINKVYPEEWIAKYRDSILRQTKKDTPIFELNYGGGPERIFESSYYESFTMNTFADAMNYLLDKVFSGGFDCVFNSNCDDYYHSRWIEKSLLYNEMGYDIVSSNFHLFDEKGIYHSHQFAGLNIENELNKNHNIICHPGVSYSRKFLENNRYNPEEIPFEDLKLWKRTIGNYRFFIQPEHLVYHRVHSNSVCQSLNR